MNKILNILLVLSACFMYSCENDDKLAIKDINEAQITGIADSYEVIYQMDSVVIIPEIKWSQDISNSGSYSYEWRAVYKVNNTITTTNSYLLGTDKELHWVVDILPGTYTLSYTVTDNQTGVAFCRFVPLNVITITGKGIMVFGDDQLGYAELQMIAQRENGEEIILKGLLENSGLPKLKGGRNVHFTGTPSASFKDNRKIWIVTDEGSYYLNYLTLQSSLENTINDMVYLTREVPDDFRPVLFAPLSIDGQQTTGAWVMLCNNGYFIRNEDPLNLTPETYGDALNVIDDELFEPAPYIAYCVLYPSRYILFDRTSRQFVETRLYTYEAVPLTDNAGDIFPYNQQGTTRDLLYMESTANKEGGATNGNSYAIMVDDEQEYHIYKFYPYSSYPKIGYYKIDQTVAKDIQNASFFAFYSNRSYLFYSVGSKLYGYSFVAGYESLYLVKDFNEEITYLKFDIQSQNGYNDLYVATYDGEEGTLHKLSVADDPNAIRAEEVATWGDLCKINSIYMRND